MKKVLTFVFCLLLLVALTIRKHNRLAGHDFGQTDKVEEVAVAVGVQQINTTDLAPEVIGYAGPTPLLIHVSAGVIDSVEVLPNQETPAFMERVKSGIIDRYSGKTIAEAASMSIDAVSGATYSSMAVKTNLQRGLAKLTEAPAVAEEKMDVTTWLKLLSGLLVALCAAVLPLFIKNKYYRMAQLTLNVAVLGFYCGSFVNYTNMTAALANGLTWQHAALVVLLVVAFLYPLLGKRGYYCAWCCPLGAAQELMGKTNKHKWTLSPRWLKWLSWLQQGLWVILMAVSLLGIWFDWMDYEFFTAFLFDSAPWWMLALGGVTLLLSVFVPRPYCRFVCPTGALLKIL